VKYANAKDAKGYAPLMLASSEPRAQKKSAA